MKILVRVLLCFLALQIKQSVYGQMAPKAPGLVNANNLFAFDMYAQLAKKPGNFVFSPFSVDTVLTMTYAGARNNTARQMAKVLQYSVANTNIDNEFGATLSRLNGISSQGTQLVVANSLWAQQGYPFLQSYQDCLREKYNTALHTIDLTGWPDSFDSKKAEAARKQMNEWVENKTHNIIKEALPTTLPNGNTRLILMDAVYFKGLWSSYFDSTRTKDADFNIGSNKTVLVPTMHVHGVFPYTREKDFDALQLDYISNRLSMIILLPKKIDGLAKLEKLLTLPSILTYHSNDGSKNITETNYLFVDVFDSIHPKLVDVQLPKFSVMSQFDLAQPLKEMGMPDAFEEAADFSGITTKRPFFIEAFIHKVYLSVDEEGTKAAATTIESFTDSEPETDIRFVVNHPFIYFIRDNASGAILFIGRVIDPS